MREDEWLRESRERWRSRAENAERVLRERTAQVERMRRALAYTDEQLLEARARAGRAWWTVEVVELLEDVRSLLVTGQRVRGTFTSGEALVQPHDEATGERCFWRGRAERAEAALARVTDDRVRQKFEDAIEESYVHSPDADIWIVDSPVAAEKIIAAIRAAAAGEQTEGDDRG